MDLARRDDLLQEGRGLAAVHAALEVPVWVEVLRIDLAEDQVVEQPRERVGEQQVAIDLHVGSGAPAGQLRLDFFERCEQVVLGSSPSSRISRIELRSWAIASGSVHVRANSRRA